MLSNIYPTLRGTGCTLHVFCKLAVPSTHLHGSLVHTDLSTLPYPTLFRHASYLCHPVHVGVGGDCRACFTRRALSCEWLRALLLRRVVAVHVVA